LQDDSCAGAAAFIEGCW